MQWGQIKTLFILSFLILDLFLLQQFLGKQEEPEPLEENIETEEQLKLENIDTSDVPEEQPDMALVTGRLADFSEDDMKSLGQIDGISYAFFDKDLLYVNLDEPIPLEEEDTGEDILDKTADFTLYNNQYSYWGQNEELGFVLFFQKTNNRTIYYNESGLLAFLVEDGEITGYYQTRLGDIQIENEQQELIQPIKAVYRLYDEGELSSGDKVTDMTIGYHSKIQPDQNDATGIQVFAPAWKVTVNNDEVFFVNATEGKVLGIDENDFIEQFLETRGLTNPEDLSEELEEPDSSNEAESTDNE